MKPAVEGFFHKPTFTYSYIAWDPATKEAALIDPVLDFDPASGMTGTEFAERQLSFLQNKGLALRWILETHAHADHVTAAPFFKRAFPHAKTVIGAGITAVQATFKSLLNLEESFQPDGSQFDVLLKDGDTLPLGKLAVTAMETPGHTSDSLTYVINGVAFVGDSIFMPDMGTARCDFPGGDAEQLYESISRLFQLPDETVLYMCHDYAPGSRDYSNVTTVGEQKARNIHVGGGKSREEFTAMRRERDAGLGAPRLLYPAVQLNIRGGELPPEESNGVAYVKIPINRFGK